MRRYPDRGLHGRAVEDLGRRIVSGDIAAGQSIDIEELSQRYDSSRGVVREALRVLGAKGMIDARPKRGTLVTPQSSWSLLDHDVLRWQFDTLPAVYILERLAEVRLIVEPGAASLAATRRTDDDLAELESALQALHLVDDSDESRAAAVAADIRFHSAILTATHNELVQQLVGVIEIGLRARDELVYREGSDHHMEFEKHAAVAAAIRAQDPRLASSLMLSLAEGAAEDTRRAIAFATAQP
jgi:DNA-binding FadR family transcriptional regulator